jgi:hypothetical protein
MSRLESIARKNGHSRHMRARSARPSAPWRASYAATAAPKPYQPGSITRHCAQENTHGIARRSSIACDFLREAGREPMLSSAISHDRRGGAEVLDEAGVP